MRPLTILIPTLVICTGMRDDEAPPVPKHDGESRVFRWPGEFDTAGSFGRAVVGEITDDRQNDVVVIDGQSVFVLVNHGTESLIYDLGLDGNDAAIIRSEPHVGSVLVVNDGGLHVAWYDTDDKAFASDIVLGGEWSGAERVVVGLLDDSNGADIVGVAAGGEELLVAYSTSPDAVEFGATTSFDSIGTIHDVALVDWFGDGVLMIAALTDAGLAVHDTDGTPVATVAKPSGTTVDPYLARLRDDQSVDRIAWVARDGGGAPSLLVDGNGTSAAPLDLGGIGVVSMNGVEFDQDGIADLVLSRDDEQSMTVLYGAPGDVFDVDDAMELDLVALSPIDMSHNSARPIVGDLDGDTDPDIALAVEGNQTVHTFYGAAVTQAQFRPIVRATDPIPAFDQTDTLMFTLDAPPALAQMNASHLRIRVWYQEHYSTAVGPETATTLIPLPPDWPLDLMIPLEFQYWGPTDEIHYIEIRLIDEDADGFLLQAYPPIVHGIATSSDALRLIRLPEVIVPEFAILPPPPPPGDGGRFIRGTRPGSGTTGKGSSPPPPPGTGGP